MIKLELSEEEVKLILEERAKKEFDKPASDKPTFTGKLKYDLYMIQGRDDNGKLRMYLPWLCSNHEKEDLIAEFEGCFEKVLDAGAIFDCYIEKDGSEAWYDRDYGIEGMDKDWARIYLTDICKVKK